MEAPCETAGWSTLQLPTDALRHLSSCLGDNTNLAAQLGLTSKFWYREVWRWQTRLTVLQLRAADSLVKRKAIIENNITHLSLTVPSKHMYSDPLDAYVAFLKRFAKSPVLRSVEIIDCTAKLKSSSKDFIPSFAPTVERFVFREKTGALFSPAATCLLSALICSPFRNNLKSLTLEGDIFAHGDFLRPLAEYCPNLEELELPDWMTSSYGFHAVYAHDLDAVAARLPRLKRLCISDDHPVFLYWRREIAARMGKHYSPEGLEMLRVWLSTVLSYLPDGLASVICTPTGSLFEIALRILKHTKTIDLGLDLNLPLQICGRHSILVRVLAQCAFSPGSTLAIVENLLDPRRNVDLWATLEIGGVTVNSLQAAILSGDQALLDLILGRCRASGVDIHLLSSAGGKLNVFHVISTAGAQVKVDELAMLKLLHARRGPLGITQTLVNTEQVGTRYTPMEAFIASGRTDCALFLYEHFGANPAPVRDALASPSILHLVFLKAKLKDPSSIISLEPILLDPRVDYKRALASENGASANWSLLAGIANGPSSQALHRALKSSTVEQNHLALCEMYSQASPNLPHEKYLIQAGADPGKNGADGMSPLMWACERVHPERVKMILQMKGSAAAANKCTDGRRVGRYPAEIASNMRAFLEIAPDLLNSLILPDTIHADKMALSRVLADVERYLTSPSGPINHATRATLGRLKVVLERQIKTLK